MFALLVLMAAPVLAQDASRLFHVKLLTDAECDMSSVESVLADITKPAMTDEEKCHAVYKFVYEHRFWYPTFAPYELGRFVSDPILQVNCFPTTICQQDAAVTSAFWAGLGYDVRYWQLGGHTTGEVFYGGKWRNFDATLWITKRDKDGTIGGVDVSQRFYKPDKSTVTPWDDYEIGHRMDLTLRRGETFTRYWSPLGKTSDYWRAGREDRMPDEREGHNRGLAAIMKRKPYRVDTKGAGFANGVFEFAVDLKDPRWAETFESATNVAADGGTGKLATKDPAKPAELVYRLRSPYVITGAWVEGETAGGVALSVSINRGGTWRSFETRGKKVTLRDAVAGRFDYLLKLVIPAGASVSGLKLTTVVQVNPLSLPALQQGDNKVRLSAGEQTDTITVTPNLDSPEYREAVFSQENTLSAREQLQDGWVQGLCAKEGGKDATLVYKIDAPGEIRRARWGGRFRARGENVNEMSWSLDGKTWFPQPMTAKWTHPESPVPNYYVAVDETTVVPPGQKTVYLKYRFVRPVPMRDQAALHIATGLHAYVDFVPPGKLVRRSLGEGGTGVSPIEVTYAWAEGKALVEKSDVRIVRALPGDYVLNVAGDEKPMMRWVRMRLAD